MKLREHQEAEQLDRLLAELEQAEPSAGMQNAPPEMASLLRLSAQLRLAKPAGPKPQFVRASRLRLMNRLRALHATRRMPHPLRRPRFWRPAFAYAALAVLILLGLSAGAVYASSEALPGQALYPLKRGVEEARLALSLDPIGDASLLSDFAAERLEEARALATQGQGHGLEIALREYNEMVGRLSAALDEAEAQGELPNYEQIIERLQHHIQVLERVQAQVPEQAQEALGRAIEHSQHSLAVMQQRQAGGSPSDLAPGKNKGDDQPRPGKSRTPGPPEGVGPPDHPGEGRGKGPKDKGK
jgi:hypothetical protein